MSLTSLPHQVKLVEVGPRDGLQNEKGLISLETKLKMIDMLADAGMKIIEAGAFVSPKWVPQMADTPDLYQQLNRREGCHYPALVPNEKGMQAAITAKVDEIAVFAAASESFSKKNINCSIAESLQRFEPVIQQAKQLNIKVRGYVSCVVGCPYEGHIAPEAVAKVANDLYNMGCYEISLGDTIGVGTPEKIKTMLSHVKQDIPLSALAGHYHDTYGQALANIYASLQEGIHIFDVSVSGLGGCPYAKGASGNVATEDVLYLLEGLNIKTGVDLAKIIETSWFISKALSRPVGSKLAQAKASADSGLTC